MKVKILPSVLSGTVTAPPSKSYAHRLLLCAGLACGESTVRNVAFSEDILATLDCICALGGSYRIDGSTVTVRGCGGKPIPQSILPCRESGSTLRFCIPLALLSGQEAVFSGSERLISRGIGVYEDLLHEDVSFLIEKEGVRANGGLRAKHYQIAGNISSQFISGMLFALPLLDSDSEIEIVGGMESGSYLDITCHALAQFGIKIAKADDTHYTVFGNQCYRAGDHTVEGDWSNAAFFLSANETGARITVQGLYEDSHQGDRICASHCKALSSGYATVDLKDCPDLAPVLFAQAALCHGGHFQNTRRLAIKESNRATAMAEELGKFGISVKVQENSVTVHPSPLHKPSVPLSSHNDHRIVMAMILLCLQTGGMIEGVQAVQKSYPNFFAELQALGLEILYEA